MLKINKFNKVINFFLKFKINYKIKGKLLFKNKMIKMYLIINSNMVMFDYKIYNNIYNNNKRILIKIVYNKIILIFNYIII